jgi:sugar lactone lactonase YvrE
LYRPPPPGELEDVHSLFTSELTVFREARAIIGESLWWNPAGFMQWCDIDAGTLHRGHLGDPVDGRNDRVLELPPPVSAFQPVHGGGYIASSTDIVFLVDEDGENERTIATIPHAHAGIRFNEAKCDPFG